MLDYVSFTVAPGETVALAGANGAGKTTLLRILAGVCLPSAGTVRSWEAFWILIRATQ